MINIATFYDKEVWTYANCFLFPVWAVVKRMEKSAKTTGDINLPPVLHTLHQYPSIKPLSCIITGIQALYTTKLISPSPPRGIITSINPLA